ncbi:MAG: hypothetical protein QW819_04340 [Candidatus Korarchaeota archaeon]|nr:hypothetical protein [Thermoproteota archaeon]
MSSRYVPRTLGNTLERGSRSSWTSRRRRWKFVNHAKSGAELAIRKRKSRDLEENLIIIASYHEIIDY